MITLADVFSDSNVSAAMEFLATKVNGGGTDTIPFTDFKEYWSINKIDIIESIKSGDYKTGIINEYEIINGKGKKRSVIKTSLLDKFISRLLAQKLQEFYSPRFNEHSHAYREGKGIQTAINQAKSFIENGNRYVVELDVKNFFDSIDLGLLLDFITKDISEICFYITEFYRLFGTVI